MIQYVAKEDRFAIPIMEGLIKYWPHGNTQKEMLLLTEVEEILEMVSSETLKKFEVRNLSPSFTRSYLALCSNLFVR